ncbi:MAG: thermonuclease family protein [Endomicrobium sp.]|jgi:micrococcal nuclease|nr:thermonuclease family protein [Endomicrobium sp.]
MRIKALLTSLFVLFFVSLGLGLERVKLVRIVDGDTIKVIYHEKQESVRFLGIDTPESRENPRMIKQCKAEGVDKELILKQGKIASEFVRDALSGNEYVWLEFDREKRDKYKRLLAYVYTQNNSDKKYMLNYILLKVGYAKTLFYGRLKHQALFIEAELRAKGLRLGFWNDYVKN